MLIRPVYPIKRTLLAISGQKGQKGSKMTKNGHFWTPKRPPRFYTNLPALANSTEDFIFGKIRHKMPNFRGKNVKFLEKVVKKCSGQQNSALKRPFPAPCFIHYFMNIRDSSKMVKKTYESVGALRPVWQTGKKGVQKWSKTH